MLYKYINNRENYVFSVDIKINFFRSVQTSINLMSDVSFRDNFISLSSLKHITYTFLSKLYNL